MAPPANRLPTLVVPAAALAGLLIYALYLLRALNFDGLSSLASDGVHYLLMARHLSPWGTPDPIASQAFAAQGYPPLFALLLAVVDAGNQFARGHLVTGLLLIASLPLLFRYAQRMTGSRGMAFGLTAVFALSPGAWMNSLDVLSENLFLLLSFVLLLRQSGTERGARAQSVDGLLLAALMLTRTVGVAMLAAVVVVAVMRGHDMREKVRGAAVPVCVCLLIVLCTGFALGTGIPDQYLTGFARIAAGESPHGRIQVAAYLASQGTALAQAWLGNWLYYWGGSMYVSLLCVAAAGLLALTGVAIRLREGHLDAWYILIYLCVILAWPHPGQMTRFVYPLAPLLLVAGTDAARRLGAMLPVRYARLSAPLFVALIAAAVLPTLSYTWNRYRIGEQAGLSNMTEFYRLPDLRAATVEAAVHARIAKDIAGMAEHVPPGERVFYHEPAYIALLARRAAAPVPVADDTRALRAAAASAGVQYLMLTRIDPRHWRPGQNLLDNLHRYEGWTRLVHRSVLEQDGQPVSILLRVE